MLNAKLKTILMGNPSGTETTTSVIAIISVWKIYVAVSVQAGELF